MGFGRCHGGFRRQIVDKLCIGRSSDITQVGTSLKYSLDSILQYFRPCRKKTCTASGSIQPRPREQAQCTNQPPRITISPGVEAPFSGFFHQIFHCKYLCIDGSTKLISIHPASSCPQSGNIVRCAPVSANRSSRPMWLCLGDDLLICGACVLRLPRSPPLRPISLSQKSHHGSRALPHRRPTRRVHMAMRFGAGTQHRHTERL